MSTRPIALIGLSGAGKSSVGRALAQRLSWRLLDTDALIVEAAGRTIEQIFAADGEARFRSMEAEALRKALSEPPCVIATGGGIVLSGENRALLRERAFVAWLDAPTEALLARLRAHDEARPLLAVDDPHARLEGLRAARAALYAEIAAVRVETAGRAVEELCAAVLGAYSE